MYCLGAAVALALPMTAIFQRGPKVGVDEFDRDRLMFRHEFKFTEVNFLILAMRIQG